MLFIQLRKVLNDSDPIVVYSGHEIYAKESRHIEAVEDTLLYQGSALCSKVSFDTRRVLCVSLTDVLHEYEQHKEGEDTYLYCKSPAIQVILE